MLILEFLSGMFLGYVIVSVAESLLHKNVQHASARTRNFVRKLRALRNAIRRAHFSHAMVHHALTYRRSHVRQFASPEEKRALDERILKHTGSRRIIRERYGLTLSRFGILAFVGPVLPVYAVMMSLMPTWGRVGMLLPLVIYPCASFWLHPYLHMSRTEALRAASAPMRWLLRARYVRFISRHHYVHHRHVNCNYNLLWLGDYLLGCHREPSEEEQRNMKQLDLIC